MADKDPDGSRRRLLTRAVRDVETNIDVTPSSDFTFAAFGMVLGDSKYRSALDLADVLTPGAGLGGPDHEGYHSEFFRMVEETQRLADRSP